MSTAIAQRREEQLSPYEADRKHRRERLVRALQVDPDVPNIALSKRFRMDRATIARVRRSIYGSGKGGTP